MADDTKELRDLRGEIDALDSELLRLINRRAQLAAEVGKVKRQGDDNRTFLSPGTRSDDFTPRARAESGATVGA